MTALLQEKKWKPVNGIVRRVAPSILPIFFSIEDGSASLFGAVEGTDRWLQTSLASGERTFMAMPYVLLARKTLRLGLAQLAGGSLTGIYKYDSRKK